MAQYQVPGEDRRDDEPELEPPGEEVDGSAGFIADATGDSFDELADRAQAVIDRTHAMEKPELEPDDASVAAQQQSAPRGPDADERPV